jgi:membrane associated rhomboid family serine protease
LFNNSHDLTPIIKSFYANKSQANEFIALAQSWKSNINSSVCVGASAAVFGLLFAFAYYFPNTEVSVLFLPFTMPVKYFVIIYGAIELYFGVNRIPGDKIAHWGHLGGIIFAYILIMIWQKSRKSLF